MACRKARDSLSCATDIPVGANLTLVDSCVQFGLRSPFGKSPRYNQSNQLNRSLRLFRPLSRTYPVSQHRVKSGVIALQQTSRSEFAAYSLRNGL